MTNLNYLSKYNPVALLQVGVGLKYAIDISIPDSERQYLKVSIKSAKSDGSVLANKILGSSEIVLDLYSFGHDADVKESSNIPIDNLAKHYTKEFIQLLLEDFNESNT